MKRYADRSSDARESRQRAAPSTLSRRAAIGALGGAGFGGMASVVASTVHGLSGRAAAIIRRGPARLAGAPVAGSAAGQMPKQAAAVKAAAEETSAQSPAWASWTQPALNVADGWSEPDAWMPVIENSRGVPTCTTGSPGWSRPASSLITG